MKTTLLMMTAAFGMACAAGELDKEFVNPPASAKPQVWWHWMAGNVTKPGITADLEAMAEVGIGGAILFDAGLGTRWGVPEGSLDFNTPEWYDTVKYAATEAKRLGLELGIANCSGWANSGGPWNTPAFAMKTVCFTETTVKGGGEIKVKLPQPEDKVGFYADIAVVAFPTPKEMFEIKDWTYKCFSNPGRKYDDPDTRVAPESAVIDRRNVTDISARMAKDGTVTWNVPEGEWTILRIGYRALNRKNGTGTRLGKGLECDKLSAKALRIHWDNYVGKTVKALGPELVGANGPLKTVLNDSYESGTQNWTQGLEREFRTRAGYTILTRLPALCGYVVDSVKATEDFYRDFRLVVTHMFAENYAGEMRKLAHACGLQLAIEPYGEIPSDDLLYGEYADIPTAEFWAKLDSPHWVRQVASIAHAKGRRIVAAESFTTNAGEGRWQNTPWSMKAKCDWVYSEGLNRIIYHRFAHQPWTKPARLPGMTMGPFGVHFDRTQTWWNQSKPWLEYQRRCQYMLQEGEFVCDAAWYCPAGYLYINWGRNPHRMKRPVPAGFTYDYISDKSLAEIECKNGVLVMPGGQRYRTLILPEKAFRMPEAGKKKLDELRTAGAQIVSFEEAMQFMNTKTADVAWNEEAGKINWIHRQSSGCDWYFVASPDEQAKVMNVSFRVTGRKPELWNPETGEMREAGKYAVSGAQTTVQLTFGPCGSWFVVFRENEKGVPPTVLSAPEKPRFDGKFELVKAEYGVFDDNALPPADVTRQIGACIAEGRLFCNKIWHNDFKIKDPARNRAKTLRVTYRVNGVEHVATAPEHGVLELPKVDTALLDLPGKQTSATEIAGDWELCFPVDWYVGGAAEKKLMTGLVDWTTLADGDMKYFSGTATYRKTVQISKPVNGGRMLLDLGKVKHFADVIVNGKQFVTLWKPPFRVDVTDAVMDGDNVIEVKVTNLWPNRIIGDDFLEEDCTFLPGKPLMERHLNGWPKFVLDGKPSPTGKKTFTTWKHWTKNDKPLESGLLGPVMLRTIAVPQK